MDLCVFFENINFSVRKWRTHLSLKFIVLCETLKAELK